MRKTVSFLLIFFLLFSLFAGCASEKDVSDLGGTSLSGVDEDYMGPDLSMFGYLNSEQVLLEDDKSDFGTQRGELKEDNYSFRKDGVGLEVSPLFLEEKQATLEVRKMAAPEAPAGIKVQAYDFSMDTASDYPGIYTITIPYEEGEGVFGAGYYNEEKKRWEPVVYELDSANNQVIITTNHLSTYASFKIEGEGTRYARIASGLFEANNLMARFGGQHSAVVQEFIANNMSPAQEAAVLGKSVIDDWLKASGVILEFEGLAYSSEFLSNLSDMLGNVGLSLALAQLAVDYSRGDERAMAVNAFNTSQGLAIGKWGTKALKVSMIGVMAIDYSLSKLAKQVIGGREDVWQRAYDLYYRENHSRSGAEWFRKLKELHDKANSPEQFNRLLDTELNMYTYRFWQEEDSYIGDYQSRAMNHAFSGWGGLNEKLKQQIADRAKSNLLRDSLEPVFRRLEEEIRYEQFLEYQKELSILRNEFNRIVTLEVREAADEDKELIFPGYYIRLEPLNSSADPRQWTGRLDNNGFVRATYTVLGHLAAGAPSEIKLYKNLDDLEKGKAEYTKKFTVELPTTTVIIGEEQEIDLTGLWKGFMVITESEFIKQEFPKSAGGGSSIGSLEDLADSIEGCEVDALLFFKEIIEKLIGVDLPVTIEFKMTDREDIYSGLMTVHMEEVFPDDQEDYTNSFSATFRDGNLEFTIDSEEDGVTNYSGSAVDNDHLTGVFDSPHSGYSLISGTWRLNRVEED